MTVAHVRKDTKALTLTLTADFDAPASRIWQLWEDPRQLERWWGPPTYPATFVDHDLTPGGTVTYYMTGPDDEKFHGWWRVLDVEAPHRLEFEDGFADDEGKPVADMPTTRARIAIDANESGGTRMMIESTFPSVEAMEQMVEMGMVEGLTLAVGQIDDLLARDARQGIHT
ncbi:MAG: SRPBCC domain-containing protein [Acidimicrobiia bacterium]